MGIVREISSEYRNIKVELSDQLPVNDAVYNGTKKSRFCISLTNNRGVILIIFINMAKSHWGERYPYKISHEEETKNLTNFFSMGRVPILSLALGVILPCYGPAVMVLMHKFLLKWTEVKSIQGTAISSQIKHHTS